MHVYNNFIQNLVVLIEDLEKAYKWEEALRIKNVPFIMQLFGIVDLLRHVKNISLYMQAVNNLPWEIEDASIEFVDLMYHLATELKAGKMDHTLPPSNKSNGQRVPAFKLLSKHIAELKQMKLSMDTDVGTVKTIDLAMKRSSSRLNSSTTAQEVIDHVLKNELSL